MKKVVLVGYMGSGKSVIGKLLSEKTGLSFIDLDESIETSEQNTIKKIFETKGEIYFRKKESEVFQDYISNDSSFILSLGGGTPCFANNHELLKEPNVVSIYLNASVATLVTRLQDEQANRPILLNKNPNELFDFIAKHLFERSYFFNQSKYKINVNNKTINEIVLEISRLLT